MASFCTQCGAALAGNARFCSNCGAASVDTSAQEPPIPRPPAADGIERNFAAVLCYLAGMVTGVLFLCLEPYRREHGIRFHAWQSIFLNFTLVALFIFGGILGFVFRPFAVVIPLVYVGLFILWVVVMAKAFQGEKFKIPILGDWAEKQAGSQFNL
jgi:uncharacterized membrane protein